MRGSRLLCAGVSLVLCGFLLLGCGGGGDRASGDGWAVEEGALTLEPDLLVSETDSFYFGSVSDIAVAGDGRIFVLDGRARHVKMLRPEGTLLDSIGGEGQGPGEFQGPRQIVVARGDSLFVLDAQSRRISVFSPSRDFAYGVPFETGGAAVEELMVPEDAPGFLLALASFPTPGTSEEERVYTVQRIDASGAPGDTIVTGPTRETISLDKGNFYVFHFVPFGVQPDVALGPAGHVHFGRTDSLRMDVYSRSGARQPSVSIPFDPVPITDEERTAELEDRSSDVRSQIADKMPETKPAFDDFVVDDQGHYWFGRPTANPDSTNWWVAQPDEKRVATVRLPSDVSLRAIRNGYAYGTTSTEVGAPAVIRYRVRITP